MSVHKLYIYGRHFNNPLDYARGGEQIFVNQFKLLRGAEIFQRALVEATNRCQAQLYAQFMTFEGDNSGVTFAKLLTNRAEAGVDVKMMVDFYSDIVVSDTYPTLLHRRGQLQRERQETAELLTCLEQNGVAIKRTAPVGKFLQYMLYRNHKKMIIIDETLAFVGGINISDHNYDWHDFMVQIEGPIVKELVRDFCSTWQGNTVTLSDPKPGQDFVLNQCAGRYSILDEIVAMIGRARESVVIQSPYLIGHRIEQSLVDAAQRGVDVKVIMPFRSNKLVYRLWVRKTIQNLDHPNITVYGFQGDGGMTHAKLVLVDGQHASFGSLNIMELEGLTQKELNIFSSDVDLAAQLQAFIDDDLKNSVPLPTPRVSLGRFTYTILYRFFDWWTQRLIRDEKWSKIYC